MTSETLTAFQQAHTRLSDMKRRHAEARHTLERDQCNEATPLEREVAELRRLVDQERSAAVSHPDEGRRVFRDENVYATRWSRTPSGTKRSTGVVEVWRADSAGPRGFYPQIGEAVVRLFRADGTPGVKCEYFLSAYEKWQFDDGLPSNVKETI